MPPLRAILASGLAAAALAAVARADLSWFDLSLTEDRPHVSFADVVAWSDACLEVKAEEWPAVERVYAAYITSWNGDGKDEDKLWDGLHSALGTARGACIDAFRQSTDAILRSRDSSNRHIEVRRELLRLASVRGDKAGEAQRTTRILATRIADSVAERAPHEYDDVVTIKEAENIRDAIVPLRGTIAGVVGEDGADAILANIVQAYEFSGTTALAREFRTIVANASRLSADERRQLAEAYAGADARLRSREAYENPRESRKRIDEELYRQVESVLGPERSDLIRSLAGGYIDVRAYPELAGPKPNTPMPDVINSAADALLLRFMGEDDLAKVEGAFGRGYWRPMSSHGLRMRPKPMPEPMPIELLRAIAGAQGDDELAIVEAIHFDHLRRFAPAEQGLQSIMAKEARLAAIANLALVEDERTLGELQTAFGRERVSDARIALARLARVERILPFWKLADRFDTMSRIPWASGSIATLALGGTMPGIATLPDSRRAAILDAVTGAAEAILAGRLAAWHEVEATNVAFDRVMEQYAQHSHVAQERLAAIQAARLAGLAACASAAQRSFIEARALVDALAGDGKAFESQYIALAMIEQDLGRTEAGRRLERMLDALEPAQRDRALTALIPGEPTGTELLRACADAAIAAGNMDDGDLGRIEAGNKVLDAHKQLRRRLDRAMRAQVAIAWRTLRELGHPEAADAFRP
ncbi:MAG: hypothetical protein RL325_1384 [Planctomycetota bacterium]